MDRIEDPSQVSTHQVYTVSLRPHLASHRPSYQYHADCALKYFTCSVARGKNYSPGGGGVVVPRTGAVSNATACMNSSMHESPGKRYTRSGLTFSALCGLCEAFLKYPCNRRWGGELLTSPKPLSRHTSQIYESFPPTCKVTTLWPNSTLSRGLTIMLCNVRMNVVPCVWMTKMVVWAHRLARAAALRSCHDDNVSSKHEFQCLSQASWLISLDL